MKRSDDTQLGAAGRSALSWSLVTTVSRIVLQIVAAIIVSRFLGPSGFAPFALAFAVSAFAASLAEPAFVAVVVREPELSASDWWRIRRTAAVVGVVLLFLIQIVAEPLITYLGQPDAVTPLRLLAVWVALLTVAAPYRGLLLRHLKFRSVGRLDTAASVLGVALVPIVMAVLGFGTSSLVAGQLVWATVRSVGVFLAASWLAQPADLGSHEGMAWAKTSVDISAASGLGYFVENVDNFAVARMFGPVAFAGYARVFSLMRTLSGAYLAVAQSASFPLMSRSGASYESQAERVRAVVRISGTLTQPAFLFLAVWGYALFPAVLGPEWAETAVIVRPIGVAVAVYTIPVACGAAILARGYVRREVGLQIVVLFLLTAWLWWGRSMTLESLAWGIAAIYALRSCGYLVLAALSYEVYPTYLVWPAVQVFVGALMLNVGCFLLISSRDVGWIYRIMLTSFTSVLGLRLLTFGMRETIVVLAPLLPRSVRTYVSGRGVKS